MKTSTYTLKYPCFCKIFKVFKPFKPLTYYTLSLVGITNPRERKYIYKQKVADDVARNSYFILNKKVDYLITFLAVPSEYLMMLRPFCKLLTCEPSIE